MRNCKSVFWYIFFVYFFLFSFSKKTIEKKKEMVSKLLNWRGKKGRVPLLNCSGFEHIEIVSILVNACKNEKEGENIINAKGNQRSFAFIISFYLRYIFAKI